MEDVMLEQARQVLRMEAEAVLEQVERIDEHFKAAVEMIMACPGRTVITGMGKSGIIGRKMAATLASTGTPSFYLHPAEGIHGDLGMVTEGDVVIALSNSGETGEVLHILPSLRRIGAKLIAWWAIPIPLWPKFRYCFKCRCYERSLPARACAYFKHNCGACLRRCAGTGAAFKTQITASQFAVFHPGGSLGRKLLLTVEDIMHSGTENPLVKADISVQDALFVITDKGLGAVSVVDDDNKMLGVLTDGDIRRGLSKGVDFLKRPVTELMTASPKTITKEKLAAQALHIMESNRPKPITVLPVVDAENHVIGLLHMTDLVRQGVV